MLIHGRWACLPIKQGLYRLKKSVDSEKFKTKLQIAGKMINELSAKFRVPVLVVCDSWFGNNSLAKEIGQNFGKTIHVLTKLRLDCILYAFPESRNVKQRGRKRKYGTKLQRISIIKNGLEKIKDRFFIYGKMKELEYSTFNCIHKGFGCEVKIVIVHTKKGYCFPILTTDITLTPRQMVEYYSGRWKIESGFKELKHELGVIDNQARKEIPVENHFELACLSMSIAWTYSSFLEKAPDRKFKTSKSSSYAFADIVRKIRNEYYDTFNFSAICYKYGKSMKKFICSTFFERSA